MLKTKLVETEELINLKRYRFPFWKTLLKIGLRFAAGRHRGSFASHLKSPTQESATQSNQIRHPGPTSATKENGVGRRLTSTNFASGVANFDIKFGE